MTALAPIHAPNDAHNAATPHRPRTVGRIGLRRRLAMAGPREDGGSLVEMAIVLPTFFLLLFGFFNIAFVMFGIADINYAANMTARYASLHSNSSLSPATVADVKAYAVANLYLPGSDTAGVIVNYSTLGNTVGQGVGIGIYYNAAPGMALKNFTVTAQAFRYITR